MPETEEERAARRAGNPLVTNAHRARALAFAACALGPGRDASVYISAADSFAELIAAGMLSSLEVAVQALEPCQDSEVYVKAALGFERFVRG